MWTILYTISIGFVCLSLISLLWLIYLKRQSQREPETSEHRGLRKKPVIKLLDRDGDPVEDEWHTYIAGISYHASKYDIGGFTGWIENDIYNTNDSRAMGVYNSFGKLLGYIPAKELEDYREWCHSAPQPCMGFVYIEEGQFRGRVKILRPCNVEFLRVEFNNYAQWVYDHRGREYIPSSPLQFDTE